MLFNTDNKTLRVLRHTKSLDLVSISRAAIRFVIDKLNLDCFIDLLEQGIYAMDELFFSTLNTNLIDFPGGYTPACLENEKIFSQNIGRY